MAQARTYVSDNGFQTFMLVMIIYVPIMYQSHYFCIVKHRDQLVLDFCRLRNNASWKYNSFIWESLDI